MLDKHQTIVYETKSDWKVKGLVTKLRNTVTDILTLSDGFIFD